MITYFVTRHTGALAWAKQNQLQFDVHLEHLHGVDDLHLGDVVIGTLPINIVHQLNQRGVSYVHLSLQIPAHLRGVELTVEQLNECQATLQKFWVTAVEDECSL